MALLQNCMKYNAKKFEDLVVGDVFLFKKTLTLDDGKAFAELTGDTNPMHLDAKQAEGVGFGEPIVHGMLSAGLFSTVVGLYCPGKYGFYLAQSVSFLQPVVYDQELTVTATVLQKHDSTRLVVLDMLIEQNGSEVVRGEAKVKYYE